MASRKLRCLVCGRVFYEGQGIKISIAGKDLHFHSKSCALKFFKSLILYIDQKELERAVKAAISEYEERLKELEEKSQKKIEAL
jgi:hypothetical protein